MEANKEEPGKREEEITEETKNILKKRLGRERERLKIGRTVKIGRD